MVGVNRHVHIVQVGIESLYPLIVLIDYHFYGVISPFHFMPEVNPFGDVVGGVVIP